MRLKISQYAKMEGRKAIPNCGIDTANGIEGFVVSPVRNIILTNKFHSAIKYYEI